MIKFSIYKELHRKHGVSSVCLYSNRNCDATQHALTQCPQQSVQEKKVLFKGNIWHTKTHFPLCLYFISVSTSFLLLSASASTSAWINSTVPFSDSFTVIPTHSGSFSQKNLTTALIYQHMPHQRDYSFFHKLFCFVFHFSPCSKVVNH